MMGQTSSTMMGHNECGVGESPRHQEQSYALKGKTYNIVFVVGEEL